MDENNKRKDSRDARRCDCKTCKTPKCKICGHLMGIHSLRGCMFGSCRCLEIIIK